MTNGGWSVVCVIGVWGWILSGVVFTLKAFPARDTFNSKYAAIWGGCFIFFYALWVVGMIKA